MIAIAMHGLLTRAVSARRIERAVREAFRAARRRERGTLSVAFVSDTRIAELNFRYLRKRRPTDVLSFAPPVTNHESRITNPEWGDILIAPVYASREAKRRGIPLDEEILRLVAHGTLHLLGFDHATKREEVEMFRRQEAAVHRAISV